MATTVLKMDTLYFSIDTNLPILHHLDIFCEEFQMDFEIRDGRGLRQFGISRQEREKGSIVYLVSTRLSTLIPNARLSILCYKNSHKLFFKLTGLFQYNKDQAIDSTPIALEILEYALNEFDTVSITKIDICKDFNTPYKTFLSKRVSQKKFEGSYVYKKSSFYFQSLKANGDTRSTSYILYDKTKKNNLPMNVTRLEGRYTIQAKSISALQDFTKILNKKKKSFEKFRLAIK